MWTKKKEQYTRTCNKCRKIISVDEERYISSNKGDIISHFYHLDCGEAEWKKYQSSVKKKTSECLAELRQIWDELESKVENEDLEAKDVKRIYILKKKINELLKTKGVEDFDLTYWEVEVDFNNLKKSLTDLDNFIKENASPRTIDIANKGKYKKIRDCNHKKGIESCTDDPAFFCCSYCWDTSSPEFLKRLRRWHISNIDKKIEEHNISITEFINNSNYQKLSNNIFTSQEEIKTVYQAIEKYLEELLKSKDKGNNNPIRERERERESKIELRN